MGRSSIDREGSFLSRVLTKRLRFPSLVSPLWDEPAYETQRRKSRLFLLGPLGAIPGFLIGALTYEQFEVSVVFFAPLTTVAGFATMYLVTQLETFLRVWTGSDGAPDSGSRA